MYFSNKISQDAEAININVKTNYSRVKKMTVIAFLSALASVFQCFGDLAPGIGYLISPLATAPIFICTIFSISYGIIGYLLTMLLLLAFMPSEIILFAFTTGLLGISLGIGFLCLGRRIYIIAFSAVMLLAGISILLYAFQIPVLGPAVSYDFNIKKLFFVYIFGFLYSWLWTDLIIIIIIKRLKKILCYY